MDDSIILRQTGETIQASDLDHALWKHAPAVHLTRYYSGEIAPQTRHAEARLLWTPEALCVRFQCPQAEPLVIGSAPQMKTKTIGLWNYDVCEIFVAPDANAPEHYFEFEVAPSGEWLDLEIKWKPDGRITNWEYASGMTAAGRRLACEICVAMCIPWAAFGRVPLAGDVWRANLFRIVGSDTPGARARLSRVATDSHAAAKLSRTRYVWMASLRGISEAVTPCATRSTSLSAAVLRRSFP
jgi:hypothetical protein